MNLMPSGLGFMLLEFTESVEFECPWRAILAYIGEGED